MKKNLLLTMLVMVLVAPGIVTVQAASKVQVCHRPPGNPDNFHTITVGENSLAAHFAHGDIAGNCSASCDTLCDDGDACTVDHDGTCEELGCLATPEPVNCDDSLLCTVDSCDPEAGCQYAPIVCDDGDNCTIDTCNPSDGQCNAAEKDCGTLGVCVPETGDCDFPCDGITCDPIDQCHAAGECVLPGDCVDGAPLADGTACDDGDAGTANDQCNQGVCSGEAAVTCPCDFSAATLDCLFAGATPLCIDDTGSDQYTLLHSAQPSECGVSDGFLAMEYPTAWVEKVSTYNSYLGAAGVTAEFFPVCVAGDFFSGVLGEPNRVFSISEEEADACIADLRAYGASIGACN